MFKPNVALAIDERIIYHSNNTINWKMNRKRKKCHRAQFGWVELEKVFMKQVDVKQATKYISTCFTK